MKMTAWSWSSWSARALLVARLGLGAIFLYAAYTKLKMPWISFAAAIEGYKLLPESGVIFVARTLPWFEAALGVLLVAGVGLRWVAGAASVLLVAFFAIMVRSYALGLEIECGCFGPGDALSWKTLVRDGLMAAASVALTYGAFRAARSSPNPETPAAVKAG
jgi:uncharacterized membrane protein YphA (DoxX/SURF4 family)